MLDENLERGRLPTFDLVQVAERLGLQEVRPSPAPPDQLVATLLDAMPEDREAAPPVSRALQASTHSPDEYSFLDSWFEEGERIRAVFKSNRPKKRRIEAVVDRVLPQRRRRWGKLLAWTAAAAQEDTAGDAWIDFALVARELLGERPLAEIPVATWIATNTVEVFSLRS